MKPKDPQPDSPTSPPPAAPANDLPSHWLPSNSSILTRVPADLRRRLNRAIINFDPASYTELFSRFNLAAHAVSFTAFYYYARRLRVSAALAEYKRRNSDSDLPSPELLPDALADILLDAVFDVRTSSRTLERLARAYRQTQMALASRKTIGALLAEKKRLATRRDLSDLRDVMRQITDKRAAELVSQLRRINPPADSSQTASASTRPFDDASDATVR